jgi:hypothetical protein
LELVDVLKPIKHAVKLICKRSATLPMADDIFLIILKHLESSDLLIYNELFLNLQKRLKKRRTIWSDVAYLLENSAFPVALQERLRTTPPSTATIIAKITSLVTSSQRTGDFLHESYIQIQDSH